MISILDLRLNDILTSPRLLFTQVLTIILLLSLLELIVLFPQNPSSAASQLLWSEKFAIWALDKKFDKVRQKFG